MKLALALTLASLIGAGVVVVHEWMGLGDHARESARKLAALGYAVPGAVIVDEDSSREHEKRPWSKRA